MLDDVYGALMPWGASRSVKMLFAALVLSACAADVSGAAPQVSTTAPPPPSPSPSTSTSAEPPAEVPPLLLPEAQVADIYGGAAFIRHYFDVVNYAYRTGDVAAVAPLRQDDCKACLGIEDTIAARYSAGNSIVGGAIELTDVVVTPGTMSGLVEASIVAQQTPGEVIDASGRVTDTISGRGKLLVGVNLERTPTGWLMSQWGTLE